VQPKFQICSRPPVACQTVFESFFDDGQMDRKGLFVTAAQTGAMVLGAAAVASAVTHWVENRKSMEEETSNQQTQVSLDETKLSEHKQEMEVLDKISSLEKEIKRLQYADNALKQNIIESMNDLKDEFRIYGERSERTKGDFINYLSRFIHRETNADDFQRHNIDFSWDDNDYSRKYSSDEVEKPILNTKYSSERSHDSDLMRTSLKKPSQLSNISFDADKLRFEEHGPDPVNWKPTSFASELSFDPERSVYKNDAPSTKQIHHQFQSGPSPSAIKEGMGNVLPSTSFDPEETDYHKIFGTLIKKNASVEREMSRKKEIDDLRRALDETIAKQKAKERSKLHARDAESKYLTEHKIEENLFSNSDED